MKSIFKHKYKIILSTLFAIITLSVLTLAWILFIPSFNITHIRNTLAHKSEVTEIIEEIVNAPTLTDDTFQRRSVDIKIIYEYTPTCIVALTVIEWRIGKVGAFFVLEFNQAENWHIVQSYDGEGDILPTRPSDLGCTNGD